MNKTLTIFFLLIGLQMATAQKEAAIWYFGRNAGVDFNSGAPVALTDGALNTLEGCATISDSSGNLLLYSDGITIWNRNHQPMPNGTGLLGDPSSTQSGIIIPKPGDPNIYYVFSLDDHYEPDGLRYSIVDMTLDGGLGDVTAEKNVLLYTPVSEKITAVTHANGSAIWVIAKAYNSNDFLSYLIDASGINTTPVVSALPVTGVFPYSAVGCMKTSSDGTTLAIAYAEFGRLDLHQFDTNTGVVSGEVSIDGYFANTYDPHRVYGVEFSRSGQILYTTTRNGVYQFDISSMNSATITASGLLLSQEFLAPTFPYTTFPGALQMGIDGKIYCPLRGRNYLMVVNEPEILGPGCNFVEIGVDLGIGFSQYGLPPFITSFFHVGMAVTNFCLGEDTEFSITTNDPIVSILWDFGDGNTSTLENPTHVYAASGDYTVSVTANTATETKTETKDITIYQAPIANLPTNFEICSIVPNVEIDLSLKDVEILGGQSPTEFMVTYYPTFLDAENATNALPNLYININAAVTLFARIYNVNNPSCYETIYFDVIVKPAPVLNAVPNWTVCDTDLDGFYNFDLSQKNAEVLNGQVAGDFNITYHETQADADNATNAIGPNYTNTTTSQEVFFRIEHATYSECFETESFFMEVITSVTANSPTVLEVCDNDNDGLFVFDLSVQEAQILGAQSPASFNISYHASQLDADNGTNGLNATIYSNTSPYQETIYARVENGANPDCYNTTSFDLRVYNSPVLQQITDWQLCDNDNNGIFVFDLTAKNIEILGTQNAANYNISYHETEADAQTGLNMITAAYQNTSNPQQLFYRIENIGNASCFTTDNFSLEVFDTPLANAPQPIISCDVNESGNYSFDLSLQDAEILNGQNASTFEVIYFGTETDAINNLNPLHKLAYVNNALQETIYARIQNTGMESCYDITNFSLILNLLPQPELEEEYVICPDSPELTLDGGAFETWLWQNEEGSIVGNNRTANIQEIGGYSLTVTQTTNGISCEKTILFQVISSGAPDDFTTEITGFSDNISLVVDAVGVGEFEYSIDGENFQDDNEFHVFPGTYTVFVRDKFLCRTLHKEIVAIGYQKFFTPNGDSVNEKWNIIGGEQFPNSVLTIYDRYGKLLGQLSPSQLGWDGTFQGNPLPASDYWFKYEYDTGKIVTGHFSLRR